MNSAGEDDAFVASMSSNGAWQWAKSVGGSSYDTGSAVQYDEATGYTILGLSSQNPCHSVVNHFLLGDSMIR